MELTAKQQEGLNIAVQRYNLGLPYTIISGYAGVGKSTLVQFIIDALGISKDFVAYVAYTGKAAEVLRHKGCKNAMTAHKLLYYSQRMIDGKFVFKPRPVFDQHYDLIVVDEISMLPKPMWDLLLSHHVHIIALGDPFQIPPIDKNTDNHMLDDPDIFLDEIMRQAADSEIIQLSMDIRHFDPIMYKDGSEIKVFSKAQVVTGMYTWADQIIVGTNKTRASINAAVRQILGKSGAPQVGDKIISLENHWDVVDEAGESALVNGTIGYIKDICEKQITYPIAPRFVIGPITVYEITLETEIGEVFNKVLIDKNFIETGTKTLTPKQEYVITKHRNKLKYFLPCTFDYGYAITGHRAQGSEWDKILVVEEGFPFEIEEHARWLYTAVTRASDKLVLLR